ncbi:unnamed protein product [Nezara viridula]|uniref:Uncharacterized protein n=1 Tax=Nezara viridula TaxID=85310 RepID=A0A9P0MQN4_NEZVI|nr:unnamed protein product [Nezara viridula]
MLPDQTGTVGALSGIVRSYVVIGPPISSWYMFGPLQRYLISLPDLWSSDQDISPLLWLYLSSHLRSGRCRTSCVGW